MSQVLLYLLARGKEATTYASIAAALVALHISIDPGVWQHFVDAGVALSTVAGILIKEG